MDGASRNLMGMENSFALYLPIQPVKTRSSTGLLMDSSILPWLAILKNLYQYLVEYVYVMKNLKNNKTGQNTIPKCFIQVYGFIFPFQVGTI